MKSILRAGSLLFLMALVVESMALDAGVTAADRLHAFNATASLHTKDVYLTNLGPTGARGWIYLNRIYIQEVEAGSPAAGRLDKGDYILGAGGKDFPIKDPRPMLAEAIDRAEGADGKLLLRVGNRDQERSVTIPLKAIGSRSPTWPFDCRKSATIRDMALRWLREHQNPDGGFGTMSVYASLDCLFLLASPAPEDQEAARRGIYNRFDGPPADGLNAWCDGYSAVALAEYYLATGDAVVLPRLEFYAREIAEGQVRSGGWCHGMVQHGIPGGYGEMNNVGVVCFLALAMIQECGIAVQKEPMEKATYFFGRYAGLGCIPYGDHPPYSTGLDGIPGSSGKDATGAIAFRILGDREKARAFADSVSREGINVESAHTGAFWGETWVPLGARLMGDAAFHGCMEKMKWLYELERRCDGGFEYLPNPENLTGFTSFRGDPRTATGAFGLTYALPWKSLMILGAESGPFGRNRAPELKSAVSLFQQKKWDALDACLTDLEKSGSLSTTARKQAAQLRDKRKALQDQIDWTLAGIRKDSEREGMTRLEIDVARAKLAAVERLEGAKIEPAAQLRAKLAAMKELPAPKTVAVAASPNPDHNGWKPLLLLAKDLKKDAPPKLWRVYAWTGDISPMLDNLEPAGAAMKGWYLPEFDCSQWQEKQAPFHAHARYPDAPFAGETVGPVAHHTTIYQPRPLYNTLARTEFTVADPDGIQGARVVIQNGHQYLRSEIFLNGYRVATILRPDQCELTPEALKLIRKGKNTLAVYITSCRGHLHDFDYGIEVR